jgi:hypothetical protein
VRLFFPKILNTKIVYLCNLLCVDVKSGSTTVSEFGYFMGMIGNLRFSIDFSINGDARLGFGLLKCDIFKRKDPSV